MTETEAPASSAGRPRPNEVVERDEAALKLITKDGITKEELADQLKVKPSHAYLSLFRLQRAGKIERRRVDGDARAHRWFLTG